MAGLQKNQSIRKKKDRQMERIAINADNPFGSANNPPSAEQSPSSNNGGRRPSMVVKVKKHNFGDYEQGQNSQRSIASL